MKVLVLGGTGNIGSATVSALAGRGAQVSILCRNARSTEKAEMLATHPVLGDIKTPEQWMTQVLQFDAVIHAACTFDDEMGAIDSRLTSALIQTMSASRIRKKLIYTAGAWCFGDTPSCGADESFPFNPIPEFAWGVENSRAVLRCAAIDGMVVHPSNVVDRSSLGIPPVLLRENRGQSILRAPGNPQATWPLVERDDLAQLYCLTLEKGRAANDYIGTSEEGVPVGKLVSLVSSHLGLDSAPVYEPIEYWMNKYGNWARGYSLNQVMRSHKAITELGWVPRFRLEL